MFTESCSIYICQTSFIAILAVYSISSEVIIVY